jgi:hypothetical protein
MFVKKLALKFGFGVQRHIQQYFSYIMAVSFIGGGNTEYLEKTTSHWPT